MLVSVITILVLLIVYLYVKFKRKYELARKIPGPWFLPFIGNVQFVSLNAEKLFLRINEYQKIYKDVFRIWLGTKLWVFIQNPQDIREILNNRDLVRVEEFYFLHPLIGDGLLLTDGNYWTLHRKALSYAFNLNILNDFLSAMSRHADVLVSKLNNPESIEVTDSLLLCALDTICETSMGAHINAQLDPNCAYVQAFHDASHILFKRMSNPLLQPDFIFHMTKDSKRVNDAIATLHALTDNVIRGKRKQQNGFIPKTNGVKPTKILKQALLDVLMQCEVDGKYLTDQQIKDHVTTFLFAGIDTTKSAISFLLYNIAKYKTIQDQLYEEIISTMGDDVAQEINASHLTNLSYLDRVLKESLRFHTTVPVSARRTKDEITIGDYTYPRGTSLWVNIFGISHDPKIFKDPNSFDPDRFEDQDWLEKYGEYAFIPHSAGPRFCIGKKYSIYVMKAVVIKLLLNYEIELTNPDEELILLAEMVLKSKNGINLRFRRRSGAVAG